jgi:hypothetical protein
MPELLTMPTAPAANDPQWLRQLKSWARAVTRTLSAQRVKGDGTTTRVAPGVDGVTVSAIQPVPAFDVRYDSVSGDLEVGPLRGTADYTAQDSIYVQSHTGAHAGNWRAHLGYTTDLATLTDAGTLYLPVARVTVRNGKVRAIDRLVSGHPWIAAPNHAAGALNIIRKWGAPETADPAGATGWLYYAIVTSTTSTTSSTTPTTTTSTTTPPPPTTTSTSTSSTTSTSTGTGTTTTTETTTDPYVIDKWYCVRQRGYALQIDCLADDDVLFECIWPMQYEYEGQFSHFGQCVYDPASQTWSNTIVLSGPYDESINCTSTTTTTTAGPLEDDKYYCVFIETWHNGNCTGAPVYNPSPYYCWQGSYIKSENMVFDECIYVSPAYSFRMTLMSGPYLDTVECYNQCRH